MTAKLECKILFLVLSASLLTIVYSYRLTHASAAIVVSISASAISTVEYTKIFASGFSSHIQTSGLDLWLSIITAVIMVLSLISLRYYRSSKSSPALNVLFTINFLMSVVFFNTQSPFVIYLVFEMSVIPIFLIVLGWGYQPERVKASYAIIFYTTISSVPLLSAIRILYLCRPFISPFIIEVKGGLSSISVALSISLTLGFLVKLPIYGVHLWLPLAHVEAPVFGSIILAGILLKLGGVGLIRFSQIVQNTSWKFACIAISVVGSVLVGLTCLKTTDLKSVIAFSSVSHIGLVIIIISLRLKESVWLGFLVMLTHAFSSSIIFFIRYVIYVRTGTRNMLLNKGALANSPHIRMCWLVATIASMGTPPFINLVSEVYSLLICWNFLGEWMLLIVVIFILRRAFHLVLYRSSQQENRSWDNQSKLLTGSTNAITVLRSHSHTICLVISLLVLIEIRY